MFLGAFPFLYLLFVILPLPFVRQVTKAILFSALIDISLTGIPLSLKKLLHRLFSVLLILAFGVSGACYFFFDAMQAKDKIEARERISAKDKLDIITIPLKDFKALEGANEIWYGGELYDVAGYTIENGIAYVTVYHDKDETGLVKGVAESFESSDRSNNSSGPHIEKHKIHYPNDGKILAACNELRRFTAPAADHHEPRFLSVSLQVYSAIIKPPPRLS